MAFQPMNLATLEVAVDDWCTSQPAAKAKYDNQDINDWDVSLVLSMNSLFEKRSSFNSDINKWDTAQTVSMSSIFKDARSFNRQINGWNTSQVTSMQRMFTTAYTFDQDINGWVTANVMNMQGMFQSAKSFNQDLNGWQTNQVRFMSSMFNGAVAFNQDISGWNTGQVSSLSAIFRLAGRFNRDINSWDTSSVRSFQHAFISTPSFGQNLSGWDTGQVTTMDSMFSGALSFNQNINGWDVSRLTVVDSMFASATSFNQNINGWDVSQVTRLHFVFGSAKSFDQDINGWDVSQLIQMTSMFSGASSFDKVINGWVTSKVLDMSAMFSSASAFNQDINGWDVSNVELMSSMFASATAFDQAIDGWNMGRATEVDYMFSSATSFDQDIDGWDVGKVKSLDSVFRSASSFGQDVGGWDTANVYELDFTFSGAAMFNSDVNRWDIRRVSRMQHTFSGTTVFDQDIDGWDTSNVQLMQATFLSATAFDQDINGWDTANVDNMANMFNSAMSFSHLVDAWVVGEQTNTLRMFADTAILQRGRVPCWYRGESQGSVCPIKNPTTGITTFTVTDTLKHVCTMWAAGATHASALETYGSIETWNVAHLTDFSGIFEGLSAFNDGRINQWNVSQSTSMDSMFKGASYFNQPLDSWSLFKVRSTNNMFDGAFRFDQDLGNFDTSSVTSMVSMFEGATEFAGAGIERWDVSKVTAFAGTFQAATTFNADLSGWNVTNVKSTETMFKNASVFNSDLSKWNVGPATGERFSKGGSLANCVSMFENARAFDADLSRWDLKASSTISQDAFKGSKLLLGGDDTTPCWYRGEMCTKPFFLSVLAEREYRNDPNDPKYKYVDPADYVGRSYTAATTYRIAPLGLDIANTTLGSGTLADLRYKLEGAPASWFVNVENGEILGSYAYPGRGYSFDLVAVNMAGDEQLVETFKFNVEGPANFSVVPLIPTKRTQYAASNGDFTDYKFGASYFVGSSYRFAPKILDPNQTQTSDGSQFEDITYTLRGVSERGTDGWFVSSQTGEIFGKFGEAQIGNFSLQLMAVDNAGTQASVETYTFTVTFQPLPIFFAQFSENRSRVGDEFDDYDELTRQKFSFVRGDSYRIAPKRLLWAQVSEGRIENIAFKLRDEPDGWFVRTSTGEITGKFGDDTLGEANVSFTLLAVDQGGLTVEVERYTFPLVNRKQFELKLNPISSANEGQYPIEGGGQYRFTVLKNDGSPEPTAANALIPTDIAVGDSFRFAPPNLDATKTQVSHGSVDALTFTFQFQSARDEGASSYAAPEAVSIKSNGELIGTFESEDVGSHSILVFAVDGGSSEPQVARRMLLNVQFRDADGRSIATVRGTNNSRTCPFGYFRRDDTNEFDRVFDCVCVGKLGNGSTCGLSNSNRSQGIVVSKPAPKIDGIIGGIVAFFVLLFILGFAAFKWYAHRAQTKAFDFQSEINRLLESGELGFANDQDADIGVASGTYTEAGLSTATDLGPAPALRIRAPREIKRSHLAMIEEVGKGQFGSVYKATLDESSTSGGVPEYTVAAKTVLDAKASPDATRELRLEAMVMAQLGGHPNIVSIVGVITRGDPMVLIVSFCEHGSLLSLLRNRAEAMRPLVVAVKVRMACDIAKGMAHLEAHRFIHRDLAARNVLVSSSMEAKVADFGLSRQTQHANNNGDTGYYRSQAGVFPIRWTAPEAMEKLTFTTKSDVWSFAIVVVEVFQDGVAPYSYTELGNQHIMNQVMRGALLHTRPIELPPKIYGMLKRCWSRESAGRPGFDEIVTFLKAEMHADYLQEADGPITGTAGAQLNTTPLDEHGYVAEDRSTAPLDAHGYVVDQGLSEASGYLTVAVGQLKPFEQQAIDDGGGRPMLTTHSNHPRASPSLNLYATMGRHETQPLQDGVATRAKKCKLPTPSCEWTEGHDHSCQNPSHKSSRYCKVHACSKAGCHAGCRSTAKLCAKHGATRADKMEGKLGGGNVARCPNCQSKLAVCVCNETQARARARILSSGRTRNTKTMNNSTTVNEMEL
jgi:surface protein